MKTIALADPEDADVRPLIAANLAHGQGASSPGSDHTMDAQALKAPGIRFWTMSDTSGILGCAALKDLSDGTAEVKSLYIAQTARRRGLARELMMYLIDEARGANISALVLETGAMPDYQSARQLYRVLGFAECDPIPGYTADPNSVFMRLALDPSETSSQ